MNFITINQLSMMSPNTTKEENKVAVPVVKKEEITLHHRNREIITTQKPNGTRAEMAEKLKTTLARPMLNGMDTRAVRALKMKENLSPKKKTSQVIDALSKHLHPQQKAILRILKPSQIPAVPSHPYRLSM